MNGEVGERCSAWRDEHDLELAQVGDEEPVERPMTDSGSVTASQSL